MIILKNFLKAACFLILTGFSFYFTEKTAVLVRNQDPIMQAIKEASVELNHEAVNASITKDYIIPGINGSRINEIKSLMQMKENNVFNSLFLVTESVKPKVSLNDNKDKIIIKGNPKKGAVSFIIESKDTPSYTYLKSHNIQASLLTKSDTYAKDENLEQLNNDFENYKKLENKLNKAKTNTNICILNNYNKEICLKYNEVCYHSELLIFFLLSLLISFWRLYQGIILTTRSCAVFLDCQDIAYWSFHNTP